MGNRVLRLRRLLLCVVFSLLSLARGSALAVCQPDGTTLCLNQQRFAVRVEWKDFDARRGQGQAVGLTGDTGYFWFFGSNNIELVVKVLDGRGLNKHFWVFYGALSNVEYIMTVTDTATGHAKTYFNPSRRFASVGDVAAFPDAATAKSHPASEQRSNPLPALPTDRCAQTATALCLNDSRFRVEVDWEDFEGRRGSGQAVPLTTDTGYFWFFSSTNVELVVKVLDARSVNGQFWVFYGALSNVKYDMTVTDTVTGARRTYSNPSGTFASVGDVSPAWVFPVDEQAAGLATELSAGGSGAVQSLQNALQLSGIAVLDDQGIVAVPPAEPRQGFGVRASLLPGLISAAENGSGMSLRDLADGVRASFEELSDAPMEQFILAGIVDAARSDQMTRRLWGRLIVELGRRAPEPYDLLANPDPADVQLDAIQLALIVQRLAADFHAVADTLPLAIGAEKAIALKKAPCQLGDKESLVLDIASLVTTKGFDRVIGYLSDKGLRGAQVIQRIGSFASGLQAWVELVIAMVSFDVKIRLEEGEPLVRTKNRKAGEQRMVSGTARMDTGNSQLVNCLRPALNNVGLDLSVDEDGPIAGAKVQWVLHDDGGVIGPGQGGLGALDAIVRFYGGNPASEVTDANGTSRIGLEGSPQKEDLSSAVVPVRKSARVRMNVPIQGGDLFKDVAAAGDKIGDVAALAGIPAELLKRTRLLFGGSKDIEVRDWAGDRAEVRINARLDVQGGSVTWKLDGTVPLVGIGDDDSGKVIGRGRVTWTKTFAGTISGTFSYNTTLLLEGTYDTAARQVTFHTMQISTDGGSGSIVTPSINTECHLNDHWLHCITRVPPPVNVIETTGFEHQSDESYNILTRPLVLRMVDGETVAIPDRFHITTWEGTLTLRFGD